MTTRTIRLLHVEDDETLRLVVAHHLQALDQYDFSATCAATEDEAVETFGRDGADLVILDYQLSHGDGLSCLRRLRRLDECVPIIALSGQASPQMAAELLDAGADDFVSKRARLAEVLPPAVRDLLVRAEGLKMHPPTHPTGSALEVEGLLRGLVESFAVEVGPALLAELDALESAARQAGLSTVQLERLFERICERLRAEHPVDTPPEILARPVFLELFLRLAEDNDDGF